MKKFYLKIILPSIISILLFVLTIFYVIIPQFELNIMNGKREMIKELTNSAWSILSKYENDERNGILSRDEAQKTALSRIQYLRYGEEGKDYFWITDMHPTMMMHPYRTDLNGKDLSNFSDPHGKKLFVEFVNTVKRDQHGYVDYMWQWKDDSLHIVPKLSYVKSFKPWGWVIGTGIYIEDVKKEIIILTQKLLWISIIISLLIGFLLLFISQQSLKIEKERIEAEKELKESQEKYKTLVEAATEGLLMLIDGKISFSNNIFSQMTGYDTSDIMNLPFNAIVSENNNKDVVEALKGKFVKEGQYEINLKKKNGGFLEVLITSSSADFYGDSVNILIVKDITVDRNSNVSNLDYQKLLSTLNIGFFRAKIDLKGKFISANETAIRILGLDNFSDLSEVYILELLANSEDKKNLRNTLIEKGFVKNKIIKITKRNNETAIVNVTLAVFNGENPKDLICDGIIEDITVSENQKIETQNLISELKSGAYFIEQPVKNFQIPINTLDSDASIKNAIGVLAKLNSDHLLLTKNKKDFIGIVTNSDIQKRVLSLDLHLDNPAYLIMSSPIISVKESTSMSEALQVFDQKGINHLVVKNESNQITGLIRAADLYKTLENSLTFLNSSARKAQTFQELKHCYNRLQILIKPLILSEMSVMHVTNITSALSDTIIKKVIDLTIQDLGEPPVEFAFICLGSEGRKEETLYTDQDNAIIFQDQEEGLENEVFEYFNELGSKVCNSLNDIGYAFCKGNIMAKNPQWCQPLSVWEKYFRNWINTPDPQNLLDATIFFDIRQVYGSELLVERLRFTISDQIKVRSGFLYHLALNAYNVKTQQISSGSIISDKNSDNVDLKIAVSLIIMFVRTYALQYDVWCTNTIERLNALKEKQVLKENTADEIIYIYNFLMKLRFKNQIDLIENHMPLSNVLNTRSLLDFELNILKKALSQIQMYQNKIGIDFRISS